MIHTTNIPNKEVPYRIFQLYYPSLMTFIIFTLADVLLQNLMTSYSLENFLYIFLCVFIAVHLTGSYLRIDDWSRERYPMSALISDCVDILIAIYICSSIARYSKTTDEISYLHLSIPFFLVSINQFWWFVFMRKFDTPALLRISILFFSMATISIIESNIHTKYSLVAIVAVIIILACFMIWDKSPKWFDTLSIRLRKIIGGIIPIFN